MIHVENQSQRIPGYSEKMYRYYNRLYEKYRKKIVPVVVYAHEEKVTENDTLQIGFSFMTVVRLKYLMVHLVKENWREYIRKDRDQEEEYKKQLSAALKPEEVEQFVQITTSYHEAGRKEGREEGTEMTLKAFEAFREGKNIDEVMILTGLKGDQLLKIQALALN